MADFNDLQNWDNFFYYGQGDIDTESRFDLYQLLLQPKRSLYYNRRESGGVSEYENRPNTIELQVFGRFEIANAVAYRNTLVTDGSNGTIDRRIAVSQNSIGFNAKGNNLDVSVLYFLYTDFETPKTTNFPLVK